MLNLETVPCMLMEWSLSWRLHYLEKILMTSLKDSCLSQSGNSSLYTSSFPKRTLKKM